MEERHAPSVTVRVPPAGLAPTDRLPMLFLSRWVVEQMLGLSESTDGRVTRRLMGRCLDRLEARMRLIHIPSL